jgi:hypothetical protein
MEKNGKELKVMNVPEDEILGTTMNAPPGKL